MKENTPTEGQKASNPGRKRKNRSETNVAGYSQTGSESKSKSAHYNRLSFTADFIEYCMFTLYFQRGAYKVWQLFKVNRYEFGMLLDFVGVCTLKGRRTASKNQVFDVISGNSRHLKKHEGYWQGLIRTQMIEPVELSSGRITWILTRLGANALEAFENEVQRLIRSGVEIEARKQPAKVFKLIPYQHIPANHINELGHVYYKSFPSRLQSA